MIEPISFLKWFIHLFSKKFLLAFYLISHVYYISQCTAPPNSGSSNPGTYLSLYSSMWAYDCTEFSSMRNFTLWQNDAVTEGGCFRRRTSTGSLLARHMMWSEQDGCEQHSLSEQSVIPSAQRKPLTCDLFIIVPWTHTNNFVFTYFPNHDQA